jgi:hypothetical protein
MRINTWFNFLYEQLKENSFSPLSSLIFWGENQKVKSIVQITFEENSRYMAAVG